MTDILAIIDRVITEAKNHKDVADLVEHRDRLAKKLADLDSVDAKLAAYESEKTVFVNERQAERSRLESQQRVLESEKEAFKVEMRQARADFAAEVAAFRAKVQKATAEVAAMGR